MLKLPVLPAASGGGPGISLAGCRKRSGSDTARSTTASSRMIAQRHSQIGKRSPTLQAPAAPCSSRRRRAACSCRNQAAREACQDSGRALIKEFGGQNAARPRPPALRSGDSRKPDAERDRRARRRRRHHPVRGHDRLSSPGPATSMRLRDASTQRWYLRPYPDDLAHSRSWDRCALSQ